MGSAAAAGRSGDAAAPPDLAAPPADGRQRRRCRSMARHHCSRSTSARRSATPWSAPRPDRRPGCSCRATSIEESSLALEVTEGGRGFRRLAVISRLRARRPRLELDAEAGSVAPDGVRGRRPEVGALIASPGRSPVARCGNLPPGNRRDAPAPRPARADRRRGRGDAAGGRAAHHAGAAPRQSAPSRPTTTERSPSLGVALARRGAAAFSAVPASFRQPGQHYVLPDQGRAQATRARTATSSSGRAHLARGARSPPSLRDRLRILPPRVSRVAIGIREGQGPCARLARSSLGPAAGRARRLWLAARSGGGQPRARGDRGARGRRAHAGNARDHHLDLEITTA